LIEEQRFQIGASNPSNPSHSLYLNDLQVLIAEMLEAYNELHRLEYLLIEEQELQNARLHEMKAKAEGLLGALSSNAASVTIDLTLATVFESTNGVATSGSAESTEGTATPYQKELLSTRNKRARTNGKAGDLDDSVSE
jgi:hypothetical protein